MPQRTGGRGANGAVGALGMNLQFFSKYEKGPFVISEEMKLVEARMIETLRILSGRPVVTVRAGG